MNNTDLTRLLPLLTFMRLPQMPMSPSESAPKFRLVPYAIGKEFDSLAAAATDQTSPALNIGSFDFVCVRISFDWETGSGYTDDVVGLIRDEGTSQQLTRDKVLLRALASDDTGKWSLPIPWRFGAFSSIYMEITNNHASDAAILNVVFEGYLEQPLEG